jgi:Ca2+-binding RTX toxin-like protein
MVGAGLALSATPAGAAGPGTVSMATFASRLSFDAASGSVNDVEVSFTAAGVDLTVIEDHNHPINIVGLLAQLICRNDAPNRVVCDATNRVHVNLGNENDRAEVINNDGGVVEVYGQNGDDTLIGGPDGDRLDGGPGDDIISGGGGDDLLIGGVNRDDLTGGLGVDEFFGGANVDSINARDGVAEDVDCGGGPFDGNDVATVDATDNTVRCEVEIT